MIKKSNCRDEVREAAITVITQKDENIFAPNEIASCLKSKGTSYKESTIMTHITSRYCKNVPVNHATRYEGFERIGKGLYKVLSY